MKVIEMFFGLFDIVLILLIVIINFCIFKYELYTSFEWYIKLIVFLLFLFIIPFISSFFEYQSVLNNSELTPDSHEVMYIILRYPSYWCIGFIEYLVVYLIFKRNKAKLEHR